MPGVRFTRLSRSPSVNDEHDDDDDDDDDDDRDSPMGV